MKLALVVALAAMLGAMELWRMSPAHAETTLDWMQTAYADGKHNAFTDLIRWRDRYYLCFRHATSHMSMDGEIRVMSSPDMKTWTPCGTPDTMGDDRDPHFVAAEKALYVYFGTWSLVHANDHGAPDRGCVRSYFASTTDGEHWSKVQGVYEAGWWLWRVRYHRGAFYSAAYTASRPKPPLRETRLLRSEDGLEWALVSTITRERMAGEADMLFRPDETLWLISRTGDEAGDAVWFHGDATLEQWHPTNTGVLIHSPVFATWKDRVFVAGRGREGERYVTKIWEIAGDRIEDRITLPSGGDTAYPGLIVDPACENAEVPSFFVSWYSQHEAEKMPKATRDTASIYVGRITARP